MVRSRNTHTMIAKENKYIISSVDRTNHIFCRMQLLIQLEIPAFGTNVSISLGANTTSTTSYKGWNTRAHFSYVRVFIHSFISPSVAYMRQWTIPALLQVMACHLFGAKPLSDAFVNVVSDMDNYWIKGSCKSPRAYPWTTGSSAALESSKPYAGCDLVLKMSHWRYAVAIQNLRNSRKMDSLINKVICDVTEMYTMLKIQNIVPRNWWYTVYPKKYAHGFVVLCFVVVM